MKSSYLTFTLLFSFLVQSSFGQFVEDKRLENREAVSELQSMRLMVRDAVTEDELSTDIIIKGLNPRKPVLFESVSDTLLEIRHYRLYTISCVEPGYMYFANKFWPDEKTIHEEEIRLEPLQIGLKTDVRDISFLGNKTQIYPRSKPALEELIHFLEINPNVRLKVIGHVNGPDGSHSKRVYQKASTERAQAVIDYLIAAGIAEERLVAYGAGNTEMLYPDPQTDWQNEANRRIEIEVIGL
jgi:outer membrane protein OmpA-like peptidoglycan-associated protein